MDRIEQLPPRIVHLQGGLRAVDGRGDLVLVQLDKENIFGQFETPDYPQLYASLRSLKLRTVGVEFVNDHSIQNLDVPDWQCLAPLGGFQVREARRLWADVRHAAVQDTKPHIADVAARAKTYLDLLSFQIFQISSEYNHALRASYVNREDRDIVLFDNGFVTRIDAAIHAFVADATALRDLIAEMIWRDVQKQSSKVTRMGEFVKRNKSVEDRFVAGVVASGQSDGWIKRLTDLRNHIAHVAPVGGGSGFHSCLLRKINIGELTEIPTLHFPLLEPDYSVRDLHDGWAEFRDDETIKAALREYRSFSERAVDALSYCVETVTKLVELLQATRENADYRAETPTLTDKDIISLR